MLYQSGAAVYVEAANGGDIAVNARNLEVTSGSVLSAGIAKGLGFIGAKAGDIKLNAIFYVLCEGCRWRALPGDFPNWQTVYTYFRNWRRSVGTWVRIHDKLREWTRVDNDREPSP